MVLKSGAFEWLSGHMGGAFQNGIYALRIKARYRAHYFHYVKHTHTITIKQPGGGNRRAVEDLSVLAYQHKPKYDCQSRKKIQE